MTPEPMRWSARTAGPKRSVQVCPTARSSGPGRTVKSPKRLLLLDDRDLVWALDLDLRLVAVQGHGPHDSDRLSLEVTLRVVNLGRLELGQGLLRDEHG